MDLTYISIKGSALSCTEVDNNTTVLDRTVYSSATSPGAGNDNTQGFRADRSLWLETTSNTWHKCTDDTSSAAVWEEIEVIVLPSGGATGESLVKSSATDYDVEWAMASKITRSITADTTATKVENIVVDASGGDVQILLPNPSTDIDISVIRTDSSANSVTIEHLTATINGTGDKLLTSQYESVSLFATSTEFFIR